MRERKGCFEIYTCVVGSVDDSMQTYCTFLVCFMSFLFFFFLVVDVDVVAFFSPLRCPHVAFTTHLLPPTSNALLFAFFFLLACVRAFVFSSFFFFISCVCANTSTLGDLMMIELDVEEEEEEKNESAIIVVLRARKRRRKKKIACLHNYI